LEEGLNTYLQSENLTEFYKVLIGYSRAIFFKSDLIILDEQGSGLNKLQLEEISKINFELSKKSSVIVITHNPVLVKNVNRVINMSEGKIIEVDEKYEKNEF
jgi:ABC-type multidrug transport system fused ATPase/permease subunit